MTSASDIRSKIRSMREGGAKLRTIKKQLQKQVGIGTKFEDIERHAQELIANAGGTPNFAMVPGYHWATCVMKNEELCHGIPKHKIVENGDVISIDVGMLYQGWHLDTSISFAVGEVSDRVHTFLKIGQRSLDKAISKAKAGGSVYEVSYAMQKTVEKAGYGAATQLTGHGVGKELHMDPEIPCVAKRADKRVLFEAGQTVAIEIMYAMKDATVVLDQDKWTYLTQDKSLSAMFEETVLITDSGSEILT